MPDPGLSLEWQLHALLRVVVAGALGGLIGWEREREGKPAHFIDYVMVSVGSCLFTLVGFAFGDNGDAARVAANVATGIGFLGAGVIIVRQRGAVSGVTTAASIWAVAAVGMTVGVGLYVVAAATTVGLFILLQLPRSD